MKVFLAKDVPQVSPEWWGVRRGVPTASEFNRVITAAKADPSSQADDYIAELVGDLVCQNPAYFTEKGKPVNTFAIQQGKDIEPMARRWYAMESNQEVVEVGFCVNDEMTLGCSPDGIVGLDIDTAPAGSYNLGGKEIPFYAARPPQGGLELKCPLPQTQAKYLMRGLKNCDGSLLRDYIQQVHGQLIVTDALWWELCSYSGTRLDKLRIKVEPNEYTAKLRTLLADFLKRYETARRLLIEGVREG